MAQSLLVAVDFDGTIVTHAFPKIGAPLRGAFETLRALQAAGHRLILNTCRENRPRPYLAEAVEFCREHGVEFVSVNENRPDDDFRDGGGRKVYAHVYIDDRNLGGFPGWAYVAHMLSVESVLSTF